MYTWIDLLSIGAAMAAVTAAAAIDYKTLRIPNRLTFPFILLGLILIAVRCLTGFYIWLAALTCVVSYFFAFALWKFRLWGGGDAKLVLALFILVSPVYPALTFVIVFSLSLAIMLFFEHTAIKVLAPQKKHNMPLHGNGHLSAEDIASLCEQDGQRPMGPALLFAYLLSIAVFSVGLIP